MRALQITAAVEMPYLLQRQPEIAQRVLVKDMAKFHRHTPNGLSRVGKNAREFGDMDFHVVPEVDVDHVSYSCVNGTDSSAYSSFIYPKWPNSQSTGSPTLQKQYFDPASTATEADFRSFLNRVHTHCLQKL